MKSFLAPPSLIGLICLFTLALLHYTRRERDGFVSTQIFADSGAFPEIDDTSPNALTLDNRFPSLAETIEMVNLAHLVYQYRFYFDSDEVCQKVHDEAAQNGRDLHCHWFYHDKETGTQVMIVSSVEKDYLAVVFTGTDDCRTLLTDVDITVRPFGNNYQNESQISLPDDAVRVHTGFNDAVFCHDIFGEIFKRVEELRHDYLRLYTTGHSLGGADAILTAVALARRYEDEDLRFPITSISFGCPQIGNKYWRYYIHSMMNKPKHLAIWRLVLGWDLIPRLPALFQHVGHTIQLHKPNHITQFSKTADAYYHHYGDKSNGLAGVPTGWSATPYLFIPGAFLTHAVNKYADYLRTFPSGTWVVDFVQDGDRHEYDDTIMDDDFDWVDPPDDDFLSES